MKNTYPLPEDDLRGELYWRMLLLVCKKRGGWPRVGAVVGLAGGALSMPLALVLWATTRFFLVAPTLGVLCNVLFALALPLLALGAVCLDRLETKPPILLPSAPRPAGTTRPYLIRHRRGR